ncbi:glycosyl transferase family 1 [Marinomonas piezotolerans]|uniref:Glycosyl transferase family 1 n=1 Tax=Marinomonas piezotolerans TaxID=2213058 RepID=A0A370U9U1_9GAMM|nr:glycosyltransferase [Marinomonas piezotolerans]RDL44542.1 glycosyl transferase family 1 [Marinomonas piezotolerans]
MSNRAPLIAFFPEASFGAALNCVAIAQSLAELGAESVFVCHPGFSGVFSQYGFKEYHLSRDVDVSQDETEDYWQEFIERHTPHFSLSPLDQLDTYVGPTWDAIVETVEKEDGSLYSLLGRLSPDLVVLDNVIMFPAILRLSIPWVRVISCVETELADANVPPYLSGLSVGDESAIQTFNEAYLKAVEPAWHRYQKFRQSHKLPVLSDGEFLEPSPWLNLLLAPSMVRRERSEVLPKDKFVYLEGCVRREAPFNLPVFAKDTFPLVYVSFGSLGAIDVALMQRMIRVFERIEARFIVNVGGFLENYDNVPDNVFLGAWFAQPSIVKLADLFVHHGGNNSFCEALYFGVPSLVMPYCWDGHDNAIRAVETKTGSMLHRSNWTDEELKDHIESLLDNNSMKKRLRDNARVMQQQPGSATAANAILALCSK